MILHHPDSELAGQIHLVTTKIFHAVLISIYLGNSAGLIHCDQNILLLPCLKWFSIHFHHQCMPVWIWMSPTKRAVVDRGQLRGMCYSSIGLFSRVSCRVVCQTCEIWVDNNSHKMVSILANHCCLEANLVSNCRKKNFLNGHTICLVIK